jgi:hypothetical protein
MADSSTRRSAAPHENEVQQSREDERAALLERAMSYDQIALVLRAAEEIRPYVSSTTVTNGAVPFRYALGGNSEARL